MSVIIVGAGPYGEVFQAYLDEAGIEVAGFLDDTAAKQGTSIHGVPVIGTTDMIESLRGHGFDTLYAPLGHNRPRVRFLERARAAGLKTPGFVHASACIGPRVSLGRAVYIFQSVVIMPHTRIGDYALISPTADVAHHTTLGTGVFLSTQASIGAKMRVGDCVYVGMGATLVSDKCREVGEDALIGAGAVVVTDVGERQVMVGVPARVLRTDSST